MLNKLLLPTLLLLTACLPAAGPVRAEEDERPPVDLEELRYVPLQPSIVVNYGGASDGPLQFVKADVSVRVIGAEAAAAARYHLPALRNALVLLLSSQDEASVSSSSGREAIRAEALAELRAILETAEGEPFIDDVLFTNFLVQR